MKRLLTLLALFAIVAIAAFAQAPSIYANDGSGRFLGTLSTNTVDPYSVSNPVGIYGSPVSPYSINNPVGIYGSSVSPYSARNPIATQAPVIVAPPVMPVLRPLPVMPAPRVYAPVMPYSTWPVR